MKKISKLCTLAHIKPAFVLPLIAVLCLLAVAMFWYVGPSTEAAVADQVIAAPQETWTLVSPLGGRITRTPEIPVDPSETAVLQSLFGDSIDAAAAARTTRHDFREANKEIRGALVDALEELLVSYPNSAWAPSLRCNLGLYYRRTGRPTRSLAHWENTWLQLNPKQRSNHKEDC